MFEDQTSQSPQTLPPKKPVPPQPPAANLAQKPPDNLPIGGGLEELPEDIFAGSDIIKIARSAPSPDVQKILGDINQLSSEPQSILPSETLPPQIQHHTSAVSRKVLIFMLSAVLTAFLIIAFYLVYRIIKIRNNPAVYNQPIPNNNQIPNPNNQINSNDQNSNNQAIEEEEAKKEPEPLIEPEPEPQPEQIIEPEPIPQPEPEPEPVEPPPPVDSDGDGLTDLLELEIGSNPQVIDTDLDGLDDYSEVKIYGSNPVKRDTDADGYDDGMEIENGYNPIGSGKLD